MATIEVINVGSGDFCDARSSSKLEQKKHQFLSANEKARLIVDYNDCKKRKKLTVFKVASAFKVNRNLPSKLVQDIKSKGQIQRKKGSGRVPIFDEENVELLNKSLLNLH